MPKSNFRALPQSHTEEGSERRIGVEIEFAGLDLETVARIIAEEAGGTPQDRGDMEWEVTDTRFGDITVLRDSSLRKKHNSLIDAGLRLMGDLVPVELVTAPLTISQLEDLDLLLERLVAEGATGTQEGVLHGFGVHLNPEVAKLHEDHVVPVVRSFGLLEEYLRAHEDLTRARRLLPFIQPWPTTLIDRFAQPEAANWTMDALVLNYLEETNSRNHSLDMLPLFMAYDSDGHLNVAGQVGANVSARPTYHYRLPESRLGQKGWSLADEWNPWVLVEEVAATPELLERLAGEWRQRRKSILEGSASWSNHVEAVLTKAGLA